MCGKFGWLVAWLDPLGILIPLSVVLFCLFVKLCRAKYVCRLFAPLTQVVNTLIYLNTMGLRFALWYFVAFVVVQRKRF